MTIFYKTNFDEYYYLHENSHKLLSDIPRLKYGKLNSNCHIGNYFQVNDENLYINMTCFHDIKNYYKLNEIIYSKLQIKLEDIDYYLPTINYNSFNLTNVHEFLKDNFKTKVLISNGEINSYQSGNINFNDLIDKLSSEYSGVQFLMTSDSNKLQKDNIFYTSDIIKSPDFDLNEISYLSTFCDIIIGRASGPDVFCMVKDNYNNSYKTIVSICNNIKQAFYNPDTLCGKIWINNYDLDKIYNILSNEIKRIISIENTFDISKKDDKIYINPIIDCDEIEIKFYIDSNIHARNYEEYSIGHPIYTLKTKFNKGVSYWVQPFAEYRNNIKMNLKIIIGNNMYIKQI